MLIDLEHIRRHFEKDLFATENGIVIDSVTEDCVEDDLGVSIAEMLANGFTFNIG